MHTKAGIFNLAASALLLSRQFTNADTDESKEAKIFRTHWDLALNSALIDMDLDSTMTLETLALVDTDPNNKWSYSYEYPSNCANFRRVVPAGSTDVIDNRDTHVPKQIALDESGDKVIFTNEESALGEYIPNDLDVTTLSAPAGYCVAMKLAFLAAPLCVGKGAGKLRESLMEQYKMSKAEAQEHDYNENFSYLDERLTSEFVAARTE